MCFFSVDEIHDYYLQTWECLSKSGTCKLAEPDLVRIRYQNMRIFPGNLIHGEGFRNEISNGNSRIQLMIMDRIMKVSNCKIFYHNKFEYDQITAKDGKYYRFQVEIRSSRHFSVDYRKSGDCTSHSLSLEELIVVPSSSSQSGDFNNFSQGNLEDQQKSQIWKSRTLPLNSSKSWIVNSTKESLQTNQYNNKTKQVIMGWTGTHSIQSSQKNKKKSKERNTNVVTQSNKKKSKNVHEKKK